MRAQLSSRTTLFYKFVFPAIWIPMFGFLAFLMLRNAWGSTHANTLMAVLVLAVWTLASAFLLRLTIPLVRVELREGRLFASNYRREIEIIPGDIASVTQNVWINLRPITLHMRRDTGLGTRIRFIPPSRLLLRFWQEDLLVDQLRRLAGLLPQRN